MSAEDYDDVPGLGSGGFGQSYSGPRHYSQPKTYKCFTCDAPISFSNKRPINKDGSRHVCTPKQPAEASQQAVLFAMGAMNAIISAQIQVGGVNHIHHMNFYDVADAAWQVAAAMVARERDYRSEIGGSA